MVSSTPPAAWAGELSSWRQDRDALMKDPTQSPLRRGDVAGFQGLDYYETDAAYRFQGPVFFYPNPQRFQIVTTSGHQRPAEKAGWLSFKLHGEVHILQVYRLLDSGQDLFLPFSDDTNGDDTYPAGRYVELTRGDGDDYVLDFNRAYNPSCAYGDPQRFLCPATPAANRMVVPIEAGERGFVEPGA